MPDRVLERDIGALHQKVDRMDRRLHEILQNQALAHTERHTIMTLASDIKAMQADTLAKVAGFDNITAGIMAAVDGLKTANTDLQTRLDDALKNAATPEELQEISDGFKALNDSIDARQVAEQAIANTPVAGTPAADGTAANGPT